MKSTQTTIVYFLVFVLLLNDSTYFCLCDKNLSCLGGEREALLRFKRSLQDPWFLLSSWGSGSDCCKWYGVVCGDSAHVVRLELRAFYMGSVNYFDKYDTQVWSPNYFLEGKVNSSLLALKHLNYLDLSGNNFRGSEIPKFFGSMKQLRYLNLSNAGFGGIVPRDLGNLVNLNTLDINSLNGQFSLSANDITWLSRIPSLQYLDMSGVDLKGALKLDQVLYLSPSLLEAAFTWCGLGYNFNGTINFSSLTRLQVLKLGGNALSGSVPDAIQNMTSIKLLDLSANSLNSIPSWLGNLRSLVHLDLSGNELSGPFVNTLPKMTSINFLDLSFNNLRSIPLWLENFKSLVHLDLSSNAFSGSASITLPNMNSVKFLDLSSNSLNSLPSWLRNFNSIIHLDLSYNLLSGSVLSTLQDMTSIEHIDLSWNNLSSVPLWFRNFKSLAHLDLSSNNIVGSVPETLQTMTLLRFLDLSSNYLNSIPSWLGNLRNLVYLDLGFNALSGSIPDALQNMVNITYLDLCQNHLTSLVPTWLGKFSNLSHLILRGNRFTAINGSTIPSILNSACHLKVLDLSNNSIQGEAFDAYGNLSGCVQYGLAYLDLSKNSFGGGLPSWIGKLENLEYLSLESNSFNGSIPLSIGNLSRLKILDLSHNNLINAIPDSVGKLINLVTLDLSANSLGGIISETHLGNMSLLEHLDIGSNDLTVKLQTSWVPPFQLNFLGLKSCNTGTEIPQWIQTQKKLSSLNLYDNQIIGPLPGNIEDKMPLLNYMLLGNNQINGSIPSSLCKLKSLTLLDLSGNKLSGNIPDCWAGANMEIINLSSNKLSGTIPSSFGNLKALLWMNLNNNSFNGKIPPELGNVTFLSILDLGDNHLSGELPSWLRTTSTLRILRVARNEFSGDIPSIICPLSDLHILNLAGNQFNGEIPKCIGNMSRMVSGPSPYDDEAYTWAEQAVKEYMKGRLLEYYKNNELLGSIDLSRNQLVGMIPEELTFLHGLNGLNLSHNHLSGHIPKNIGDMKSLESLDLSDNKLSGAIPASITGIASLAHLNLSYNNLSGSIPQGTQITTLEDPSIYAGNPYLCGPPLKECPDIKINPSPPSLDKDGKEEASDELWLYIFIMSGFASGLWGAIGVLWFNKSWRHAYFRFMDNQMDNLYVAVAVNMRKLDKKIRGNNADS